MLDEELFEYLGQWRRPTERRTLEGAARWLMGDQSTPLEAGARQVVTTFEALSSQRRAQRWAATDVLDLEFSRVRRATRPRNHVRKQDRHQRS